MRLAADRAARHLKTCRVANLSVLNSHRQVVACQAAMGLPVA